MRITTADGGMPLRGGSGATATTITGLTFALRDGDLAHRGITAAWPITASIKEGQEDAVRKEERLTC
jgi:hypothetical protein